MTDLSLRIGSNELCIFWKGDQCLWGKSLCLKRSSIDCKKFQRAHPEPFLTNFWFFENQTQFIVWPNLQSELVQMDCASSERVTNVSKESFFTWNHLILAARSSKDCTPNHFWQIFGFVRNFNVGQTFTSYDRPFYPNWFIWTVPLQKGWPMSWKNVSLLETI